MALLRAKLKCADICPRTLCVPRNLQFSEREARRKLWASISYDHASIFSRQMEAIELSLNYFATSREKKQEFFSVLKYDLMNRHICSSSATTRKHFSSLELNSKRRFIVLDARFEKWEISPGIYLWTFLSFSRGMFG